MKKNALLTIKILVEDSTAKIMNKMPQQFLLWVTTLFALSVTLLPTQCAFAQSRPLPRAGFNNYSTGGGPLPSGGGMHLQEGQDRPRGAPAGVYNPGEPKLNHKLVRWESRFMPLKVWLSPGKMLAQESISTINEQRPQEVLQLLRSDPGLSSLAKCPGWSAEMNGAAKSGIEQWKEFENEGLFSFVFVDDPSTANIFLFWTERFTGDEGAGGVSTGGNTVAVLYDANEVHTREASVGQPLQGTPVIMELQVTDDSYEKLQARVAHEFGHALGIKEHSPYNDDLMCVNGIAKYLSASDKATIRWLYRQQPQYVMLPPVLPRIAAQPADQSQQNTQSDGTEQSQGNRPGGGGYRVHINRASHSADDGSEERPVPHVDSTHSSNSDSYSGGGSATLYSTPIRRSSSPVVSPAADDDSKTAKKSKDKEKDKKSKHNKDADEIPASSMPSLPPGGATQVPKEKASEGY